ncbi:MAG: hypothetical protein P9M15_07445 [Candidatus Electryoneaceae bacterium]|nr:hypothetical protein [Candidatus Electryoneaceae bacterium]
MKDEEDLTDILFPSNSQRMKQMEQIKIHLVIPDSTIVILAEACV